MSIPAPANRRELDAAILTWTNQLAPYGILTTDSNLVITSWNHWLESATSLYAEQVIGHSLLRIIPSLGERRLDQYYSQALNGEAKLLSCALHGFVVPCPCPLSEAGFSHMQQTGRIAPLLYGGKVVGTITVIEDVTEREWQSSILRRAHQRGQLLSEVLEQLLPARRAEEIVQNVFFRISPHLQLDVCLLYGVTAEKRLRLLHSIGLTPEQRLQAEVLELGEGLSGAVAQTGRSICINHLQQSSDRRAATARQRGLRTYVVFPMYAGGTLIGTLAFGSRSRDVLDQEEIQFLTTLTQSMVTATERARQEHELRLSQERFQVMADTVPDVIFTTTSAGRCDYLNGRFYTMTGLPPGAGLDFGWLQVLHPEDRERIQDLWRACVRDRIPYNTEYRMRMANGEHRWFVARARPISDSNGEILKWFGAVTDLHDFKLTQIALSAAQENLQRHADLLERTVNERTAKLRETISQLESFSYTIAHDVRAPIRAMEGYAQVLIEDYGEALDKEARGIVGNIAKAANRLDALTRDVLNYTKVATQEIQIVPVDVTEIIQDVLLMNPGLQAPHARVAIVRPLHRVKGNPTLLAQCFSNLLDNAVKFVEPGTLPQIIIRSEEVVSEGKPAVRIWVEDNGIGIDPEATRNLFKIFERAKAARAYPGTGIGLAIVAQSVSRMGGNHGLDSQLGAGSKFWIELPSAEPA